MNQTEAGNAAHDHYDKAVEALGKADKTNDVRSWQNFLDEAKARVGMARLALELREVPDARAVRE